MIAIICSLVVYLITMGILRNTIFLARRYHNLGDRYLAKGDMKRSSIYYEISNIYREKAYKSMEE